MRNLLLITMIALFAVSVSFGQGRVVTGTVTEADSGEPIPGANVVVKGTTNGTVTDLDGNYSLSFSEEGAVLIYSFVGYVTQEIEVGNQSSIDVSMASDVTSLSEVVVTGYGTQKQKEITSSISKVTSDEFQVGNVQNPSQLVQGKVAGLAVVKPGSNPNTGFVVRLRGLSTLSGDAGPLVVVDGIVGADLNNVDPNDIASMNVLKDASAGAIYGTRGSNGVIIVTTKQGQKGKTAIEFDTYIAAETPYNMPDVLTADEWREFSEEIGKGVDYGASTDWFDEMTQTGVTYVANLAVGGGTENTTYRVSLNYRNVEGIALNTGFERVNMRLNLNTKGLNDRLSIGMNVSGSLNNAEYGNDGAFKYASIYNPTAPVRSDDPEFDQYGGYFQQVLFDYLNPVAMTQQQENNGNDNLLNIQLTGGYELIDNLIFRMSYSFQMVTNLRNYYSQKNAFGAGMNRNGLARKGSDDHYNELFDATLSWNGDIGSSGTLDVVGGYSYQYFINQGFSAEGGDFITDAYTYNRLGAAKDFDEGLGNVTSYKNSNKLIAFFARANLSWDQTYFLSLSGRYEGSSRFGVDEKYGFFPGISGGVELANFINSSSINELKVRASYGETGNNLGQSYLSLVVVEDQGNSFYYNGGYVPAYGPQRNANPYLGWESKNEVDIGLDYAFFNDKLFGSIDYYNRKTEALLYEFKVPQPPNLAPTTWANVGDLRNSGIEVLINYKVIDKADFDYTTTLTGTSYLSNDIVSLSDSASGFEFGIRDIANMGSPGQNDTPLIHIEEGAPMGQLWGLIYEGISEDGQWVFKDIGGGGPDGNEPDGEITDADRAVIGNGLPNFEFGWGNTFKWKNWDANIFFRGIFGHELVNSMRGFYEVPGAITSYNLPASARDLRNPETGVLLQSAEGKVSSFHVEKGNYFKLQNLSIGYNFNLNPGSSFTKIRIYFAGNNLATWTGYQGAEPEVRFTDDSEDNAGLNNPLAPGIDRRDTWFLARSYSLGISLGF